MSTFKFYTEQAEECRAQASATDLVNVRDRCLQAAQAWDGMADRVRRTETYRVGDAERKSEQATEGLTL
jgi:hypothetical protein